VSFVYVRIDLCSQYTAVTQHFLHNTQVGTVLNHVCGKGMTKGMGRYDFFYPCFAGLFLYHNKHHVSGKWPAIAVKKHVVGGIGMDVQPVSPGKIQLQSMYGMGSYRNKPLFIAFSYYFINPRRGK
jgi:hypothetical protein